MTDQRLRELLTERVADVTTIDLASGAWDRAAGVRRRRRAAAGVVVAVVAVVGATSAVVSGPGDHEPTPPPATSSSDPAVPRAERDGRYAGADVWWAPSTDQEARLPRLRSALPAEIDLGSPVGDVPAGVEALALFQLWGEEPGEVIVLGRAGTSYTLDASRLDDYVDARGNTLPVVTAESLAPDGRHAFFVQERSLEVYDFGDGSWTSIPTERWAAEGAAWQPPALIRVPIAGAGVPEVRLVSASGKERGTTFASNHIAGFRDRDDPYGRSAWGRGGWGAQAMYLAGPVGRGVSSVDAVAVVDGTLSGRVLEADKVLAMRPEAEGGRWNQCCPVIGWLGNDLVLFESRSGAARILAWRPGTPDLFRVSDIRGWTPGEESYVASFADLG